ncbi:uncharacterized protein [Rhodnius prolixus]|uniref:Putative secreted protein panstrongylus lignarius n=1 Tax=Rhodnius prolixus TaxID=13249 RepID=A0A4P6DA85_RHOPR
MHLAVGGALAKAASVKVAAMALVLVASTTAALCLLRRNVQDGAITLVERTSLALDDMEGRAETLARHLAIARESVGQALERRKAERTRDSFTMFWPGCLSLPCRIQHPPSVNVTEVRSS